LITLRGVCHRFGGAEILKDIDLEVHRGEALAIIGPTGAGKTTLLRIIDLLERPTSGSVYFDGIDTSASEKVRLDIRRRMAIVFQKPIVFNASVYDNVAYGLRIRQETGASLEGKVRRALETAGLSGYEERQARTLSGGEMQRVALARALVIEPEVLLLDEPTANLDPVSTGHVERLLAQVIRETTVIMATHDMSQGQRLADRIGVLINGELLQSGSPEEIFNLPRNREIAEFVGVENILEGVIASNEEGIVAVDSGGNLVEGVSDLGPGEAVWACIRPEEVTLAPLRAATSARNSFPGKITRLVFFGPLVRVEIDCGFPLVSLITRRSAEELGLGEGSQVYASFKATGVHIIRQAGGT